MHTSTSGTVFAVVSLLLGIGVPAGFAATIEVPGDQPTIRAGIDAAAAGDTVLVACGTYAEHDLGMKSGIVVRSAGGVATCATIDAGGAGRVMSASHVTGSSIEGFTFRGGSTLYGGGGLYCEFSSLAVRHCRFIENSAVSGGALVCHMTSADIIDCELTGNTGVGGGAMVITYPPSSRLTGCTFSQNTATEKGGAITLAYGASAVVTGCIFSSNQAGDSGTGGGYGGAVRCESGSPAEFVNCTFLQNYAPYNGQGGAVSCAASGGEFTDCLFQGNTAEGPGGGGALYAESTAVTVAGCTFRDNHSTEQGGGILAISTDAAISDCRFDANSAGRGGGIACRTNGSSTIARCTFTGNHSDYDWGGGGGMICQSSSPLITDCVFAGNDAGRGAIWAYFPGTTPEIRNCTMVRNTGSCTSALAVTDLASATVRNCIIAYNEGAPAVACFPATFCWWTSGAVSVSCTDIFGNPQGDWVDCVAPQRTLNGNLAVNPVFCDSLHGDWHISSRSPCAPSQQPSCGLIGALGVGCWGVTSVAEPPTVPVTWGRAKAIFR